MGLGVGGSCLVVKFKNTRLMLDCALDLSSMLRFLPDTHHTRSALSSTLGHEKNPKRQKTSITRGTTSSLTFSFFSLLPQSPWHIFAKATKVCAIIKTLSLPPLYVCV